MSIDVSYQPDGSIVVTCGDAVVRIVPPTVPQAVAGPPLIPRDGEVLIQWVGPEHPTVLGPDEKVVEALDHMKVNNNIVIVDLPQNYATHIDIDDLVRESRRRLDTLRGVALNFVRA
jgi:hypothetical protein